MAVCRRRISCRGTPRSPSLCPAEEGGDRRLDGGLCCCGGLEDRHLLGLGGGGGGRPFALGAGVIAVWVRVALGAERVVVHTCVIPADEQEVPVHPHAAVAAARLRERLLGAAAQGGQHGGAGLRRADRARGRRCAGELDGRDPGQRQPGQCPPSL